MSTQPHVIVLGLGITGSSIAATLVRNGFRVTAIEQFDLLHERGSSHGDTRIYRRIPHEGPAYVELAARSWEGWHAWGELAGKDLLISCGGIDAGPSDSRIVIEAERLCSEYRQTPQICTGEAFNRSCPGFNLPSDWRVVYQKSSGIVQPDATRKFLHEMARASGATILSASQARLESPEDLRVNVAGKSLKGDILIVAAGCWLARLFPDLPLALRPERRVMAWYRPMVPENLLGRRFPIFCLDADGGWYGMPTPSGELKIGHDKHLSQGIDPDQQLMAPDAADEQKLAPCIRTLFTGFQEKPTQLKSCIYTLVDDHHFIIDWHPRHSNILIFSCCSGHGFKYAPEYGEIASDLLTGKPRDVSAFSFQRKGSGATRFSS